MVEGERSSTDNQPKSTEMWSPELQKRLDQLTNYLWTSDPVPRPSSDMDEIIPNLFVGNVQAATSMEKLTTNLITHVLNVRTVVDWVAMIDYDVNGIEFAHISMADDLHFDMKRNINAAIAFIKMALSDGGKVLVHCHVGRSRAPTVVAAYLIKEKDYSALSALIELVTKRPKVFPNDNFLRFLCKLEEKERLAPRRDTTQTDCDVSNNSDLK